MNNLIAINNVRGYLDPTTGTAYLNAEDIARGFGFVEEKGGIEYVKWRRVNAYLHEFGFSPDVAKNDFLPENMVYRLGFKASNETAQRFQAVLADEVIPAIRKTGGYIPGAESMSDSEIMAKALIVAQKTIDNRNMRIRELEDIQKKQRPKVLFADAVSVSEDVILIGALAKILHQNGIEIGQKRLFDWLRGHGYLIKSGRDRNMPTQKSRELNLFKIKERAIDNPDGSVRLVRTTLVTGKGQQYFINRFIGQG